MAQVLTLNRCLVALIACCIAAYCTYSLTYHEGPYSLFRAISRQIGGLHIHLNHSNRIFSKNESLQLSSLRPIISATTPSLLAKPSPGCHPLSSLPPHLNKTSLTGIPNLIHLIYANTNVPEEYAQLIQHCVAINSEHMNFVLWTNDDAKTFLESLEQEYKQSVFDNALYELERSDVLRYIVLHHFGGMYMDMDEECKKPLWPLLNEYPCLLDQEEPSQSQLWHNRPFIAMNAAMACRPSHPFFQQVIKELHTYIRKSGNVIDRTGPLFLTDVYNKYVATPTSQERNITLLPSSAFSPLKDSASDVLESFRGRCKETEKLARNPIMKQGCDTWAKENYQVGDIAEKTKNSYLVHKFLHLGHLSGQWKIRKRINLCSESKMTFYQFSLK